MLRFLLRAAGYLLIAAAFITIVIDGAGSIANGNWQFTPFAAVLQGLLGTRYQALQPAIERSLHPLVWDPAMLWLAALPAAAVGLAAGFALLWAGRPRRPGIGIDTRG